MPDLKIVPQPDGTVLLKRGKTPIILTPEEVDEVLTQLGALRHRAHQEAGKEAFYASRPDLDPTTGLPHDWPKEQ